MRVDPNRIFVIHEGPLEGFEAFRESEWADFSVRNRIRARYFLSISSGAQHKNIRRLVHAFVRMKDRTDQDYQLILAGHGMDRELSAFLDDVDHRDSVVATGFVSGIQKQMLLRNATAYVFPSLYEGFGLPALEAESSGLPLAASKAGSLPEICGGGALYFDATSVDSIATALADLATDGAMRQQLIRDGYANVDRFSWKRTAQDTASVLRVAAHRVADG